MYVLMLIVTVCWAGNIVAGKHAERDFGTLPLAQLRVLGAALIYVFLFLAWRRRPRFRPTGRGWMFLLVAAFNGIALNQFFFISGIARTSVAHAGLIIALGPVMVLVLACVLRLENLTVTKFAGMLVSFAGVVVLTLPKAGQGNAPQWKGDVLLVVGGLVFAYYTIQVKQVADQIDTLTLNTVLFSLGALVMIPFTLSAVLEVRWAAVAPAGWWGLAFMIVFGSVLSYLIYAYALASLSPSRVSAFAYFQPVIASALGIWFLDEKLTGVVGIGGALIMLGVYLSERERGEEAGGLEPRSQKGLFLQVHSPTGLDGRGLSLTRDKFE